MVHPITRVGPKIVTSKYASEMRGVCECVRIKSTQAFARARSCLTSVCRIRVNSHQHSKSPSLRGWRSARSWGFESPLPHHAYGVMLHGVFRRSAFALGFRARVPPSAPVLNTPRNTAALARRDDRLLTALVEEGVERASGPCDCVPYPIDQKKKGGSTRGSPRHRGRPTAVSALLTASHAGRACVTRPE